ncbi:hypothetical protein [Aquirufa rosea]|nr:hypothetical protein [Aquirufa rosea]
MWNTLKQPWDLMRIARLLMGGYAMYEAISTQELFLGLLAGILLLQAWFNWGCGAQGCNVPFHQKKMSSTTPEETSYEEVHSKP